MSTSALLTFPVALAFAAVHVFSSRLRFLDRTPRSRSLSFAGGVILNVLKEELPEERESRFSAFAFGVLFYAGLLLTL